jgi:ElaB/YqjD/DUF883 family membrane-anchored ribosome-binding protein
MKLKHQAAMLAAMIAFAGCSPSDQKSSEKEKDPTLAAPPPIDAAPAYSPKVADAPVVPPPELKDTVAETKDEFVSEMDKKMKDLDAKISELAEKSKGYQADAKTQADQALASLREQRDKVNQKFEQAKAAAADAWKDMKSGVEVAMNQLETAYENAKSKFN